MAKKVEVISNYEVDSETIQKCVDFVTMVGKYIDEHALDVRVQLHCLDSIRLTMIMHELETLENLDKREIKYLIEFMKRLEHRICEVIIKKCEEFLEEYEKSNES